MPLARTPECNNRAVIGRSTAGEWQTIPVGTESLTLGVENDVSSRLSPIPMCVTGTFSSSSIRRT